MKKIICVLLTITVVFSAVACSSNKSNDSKKEKSKNEEVKKEKENITDDGYSIVDNINIDTDEMTVKYVGNKLRKGKDEDGNNIDQAIIYFEYTNKTSNPVSFDNAAIIQVFQNGEEMEGYAPLEAGIKELENTSKEIMDGKTIKIAVVFGVSSTKYNITIKATNEESDLLGESGETVLQQQEAQLSK